MRHHQLTVVLLLLLLLLQTCPLTSHSWSVSTAT
jgi:hypothetical protein